MFGRFFTWAVDSETKGELDLLKKVLLFKGLSKQVLRKLLVDLYRKGYEAGETIFSEGENGQAVYILLDGSVTIVKATPSGNKVLARLGPGSYFGELALIDQSPRFATALAEEKTDLLIMYKSYFDDLLTGNKSVSSRILLNLVESLSRYIMINRRLEGEGLAEEKPASGDSAKDAS
ncbi:MAG TPA: cyclic nucleotide-binding domain-containing protein [Thermodesulfovibrionales bacterium]|nr:cyclic nucleotide-binding domain-containing protein [Thermodesulfovibrionales bacterium]